MWKWMMMMTKKISGNREVMMPFYTLSGHIDSHLQTSSRYTSTPSRTSKPLTDAIHGCRTATHEGLVIVTRRGNLAILRD